MKVNLDKDNRKKTIKVYCSKIKGEIDVEYIDVDTNEIIKKHHIEDLELGEHEIDILPLDGYDTVMIKSDIPKEQNVEIEIKEDEENEEHMFDMDSLAKEFGISTEVK